MTVKPFHSKNREIYRTNNGCRRPETRYQNIIAYRGRVAIVSARTAKS